jgi:predicted N-acetyltransferase YhbS
VAAYDIRRATLADAEDVARVINAAFVVERIAFDGDRIDALGVRELMRKGFFLVAHDGGALVGCVYVEPRGERSYLGLLAVFPGRQGSGLGRRLMAAAEKHARVAGSVVMDLRIISPRAVSLLPFYLHLGYMQTGTAPFSSDAKAKVPGHYILMEKALT